MLLIYSIALQSLIVNPNPQLSYLLFYLMKIMLISPQGTVHIY